VRYSSFFGVYAEFKAFRALAMESFFSVAFLGIIDILRKEEARRSKGKERLISVSSFISS
jgi:hypothetical protein